MSPGPNFDEPSVSVAGTTVPETFEAVPAFRLLRRKAEPGKAGLFVDGKELVLQQAFRGTVFGAVKWMDVPIVEEEDANREAR